MSLADEMAGDVAALPGAVNQSSTQKPMSLHEQMASDLSAVNSQLSKTASQKPITEGQAAKQRIFDAYKNIEMQGPDYSGTRPVRGAGESALSALSGIGSSIAGGWSGTARTLYGLATGEDFDTAASKGADVSKNIQSKFTYQPRTGEGQLINELVNVPVLAVKQGTSSIGGDIGQAVGGEKGRIAGESIGNVAPDFLATLFGGRALLSKPKETPIPQKPTPPELTAPAVEVSDVPAYMRKGQEGFGQIQRGAQGQPVVNATQNVPPQVKTTGPTLADTPPEFQAAAKGRAIDSAMQRHIESQSLPIPVNLTKGQATGNVNQISFEQNTRGANPALANTFADQNPKLIANIDAIKNQVAPNVTVSGTALDQALIDSYKKKDAPIVQDIDNKYQALRDANGGQFPVDATTLYNNIQEKLSKELLTHDAPAGQLSAIKSMAENGGNMTFEQFLNLRRNLGNIARTSQDGNVRTAAGVMVKELEELPLSGGAEQLQPLAQAAREAARARFKLLESDPAYKAAVSDETPIGELSPIADKFIQKYVINGKTANVQTMLKNLESDPLAKEHIAAGVMDHIKLQSGIDTRTNAGNLSQSGLNKAIRALDQKKNLILDPKSAQQLDTLGNVARYTQEQPRGSFVNNSNTFTAAAAEAAKSAAEGAANFTSLGIPVGSWVRKGLEKRKQSKMINEALEPAAGTTKLKDFP